MAERWRLSDAFASSMIRAGSQSRRIRDNHAVVVEAAGIIFGEKLFTGRVPWLPRRACVNLRGCISSTFA